MVEAKNLTKYYGKTKAIENVSFLVEKGEIVGLLGPNAAGKTTIMRILTCFLTPTSGTAIVNGYDILENPFEVQKSVGYLPEKNPLYEEFTVSEFLNFVCEIKGIIKKQDKIKRISKAIEECGLSEVKNKSIYKLSKGYKQRVGIAQAIINDPPVLILDEPTIGLDPKQTIETRNLIKNFARKRTIFLSSHILPEVSMVCERVIIINEGKIIAVDTIENLTSRLKGATEIYLEVDGDVEKVEKVIGEIEGVKSIKLISSKKEKVNSYNIIAEKDVRKEISEKILTNGFGLLSMRIKEMSLEDIFLKLTTKE
ncbi:MAG: ABC transporter ATP-binding protein [Candidatus Omnitrophica bacterium]|nr:ABC transporter ATP-binding protein [Candidatus Omnitrophota bacterium]MCM8809071.1 ABC transporter ATP-binding protein [Candidatus Omnitrophota bacterium]MCM8810409.1 ABC transporter ATP-binding protein [Candidatus Omnitrophota bacterium]MCM8833094.1 ABC transporter ATP-binding protein [Candidatus Omnitrophota bacterium]